VDAPHATVCGRAPGRPLRELRGTYTQSGCGVCVQNGEVTGCPGIPLTQRVSRRNRRGQHSRATRRSSPSGVAIPQPLSAISHFRVDSAVPSCHHPTQTTQRGAAMAKTLARRVIPPSWCPAVFS
jgi:hypothetical protein